MSGDEALKRPFEQWLQQHRPEMESVVVGDFEMPKSGFSAKTVFVPVRYCSGGVDLEEKLVLRLENPEPAIYPRQAPDLDVEIKIQYRAMEALAASGKIPLAPLYGFEGDASFLGQPFFVMGFIGGDVMVENPPYTQSGFFAEASPAEREKVIVSAVASMADFHSIEWQGDRFDWLVAPGAEPDLARQIDLWEEMGERELQGRKHPDLDRAFRYLRDYAPKDLAPALSWGDSRPGNIIFRNHESVCLTDFENIALAPKEIDLGYWLMFDRTMHESIGTERLPGEPTRKEQTAIYAERAGIAIPDTYYHEVFGAARYAVVVVRVMNRLVDRGNLPKDQMVWLQNPAAAALTGLLAESSGG